MQGLRERGWIEGQNFIVERRCCWAGNIDKLNEFMAELVRLKVDLLLVGGPQEAVAAKKATSTIPIVFLGVAYPVEAGLIESFAHPGGNVTGASLYVIEGYTGKLLELLKETVPSLTRPAHLINPTNPIWEKVDARQNFAEISRTLKITGPVQILEARTPGDLAKAFATATRQRVDGLLVTGDALFSSERKTIGDLALTNRLPSIFPTREYVGAGGLMCYGADFLSLYRRGAVYVDKVLRGANPGDTPIERPTKFELVINLKTAKALGLTIPQSVLIRADHIIE